MRRFYPICNVLLFIVLFLSVGVFGCGTRNKASKSVDPVAKRTVVLKDSASVAAAPMPDTVLTPSVEIPKEPELEDKFTEKPTPEEDSDAYSVEEIVVAGILPEAVDSLIDEAAEAVESTEPAEGPKEDPQEQRAAAAPQPPAIIPGDSVAVVGQMPSDTSAVAGRGAQDEGPRDVDFTADRMIPVTVGDSTAISLVGNVIFHHNGAVITCDSAIRFSATRMECFKRVVINQDSTYVYGDRADYNGDLNMASVYAPIIKVVDGDAVLYTYIFTFNTLDNIGRYGGGGTMSQKDNMMESERGYYFVDTREFVGVDRVELRNPEYSMMSDSVSYNLDTEIAQFFSRSTIWNDKGEILSADRGYYNSATADYKFRSNSYAITETREIWSDTLDYNARTENAVLRSNIQMRDDEESVMAFGDFGQYWGEPQNALLTREPSLLSFDPEQPDTLYMRSDTMLLNTYPIDYAFDGSNENDDEAMPAGEGEFLIPAVGDAAPDSLGGSLSFEGGDSLSVAVPHETLPVAADDNIEPRPEESVTEAEPAEEDPGGQTPKELKKALKEEEKRARNEAKAARAEAKRLERERKQQARLEARMQRYGHDDGHDHSGHDHDHDTFEEADSAAAALLAELAADSLQSPATDSLAAGDGAQKDSLQRVLRAFGDVRIFREDLQAVCDSLVGFSRDSTLHLYINPVLWTENNQIKSDRMVIFTRNEQLYKAEFIDNPFMSSEVDPERYNQIKGRHMVAWFRDNEIYRHDVTGNGQTYYYMLDDETEDIIGFFVMESADITFLIEGRKMDKIIWRVDPDYTLYPIDKISPEQDQLLPGFVWEGERRPKSKEDVFTRTIRPSQREEYESKPKPRFPLTESIMNEKERMIREGFWRERNDTLSPETLEFIRSLAVE